MESGESKGIGYLDIQVKNWFSPNRVPDIANKNIGWLVKFNVWNGAYLY